MELKFLGNTITIDRNKSLGGTSTITRDLQGKVTGTTGSYSAAIYDVDKYLSVFRSQFASKNLVTLFHSISEFQFPIMAIARRVLKAQFCLKDFDSDSVIWNNKEINKFLSQPNELQSFDEFLTEFIAYFLVTGNGYIYSSVPDTISSSIPRWKACDNYYVLPADQIESVYPYSVKLFSGSKKTELIKNYRLLSGMGNREFPTNNVLHLKDTNLLFNQDKLKGRNRSSALEYPLSNLCAVYEARNVIYVKRGALGAIVNAKKDDAGTVALSRNEKLKLQEDFNKDYGLEKNKGQFIISDVPLDFLRFNMSITELEPFKETLEDAVTIAGIYDVPSILVPRSDSMSSFNDGSYETAEKSLYINAVIPLANRIVNQLNTFLGFKPEAGNQYIYADFSKVECLQENKKDEAATDNLRTTTAILKYMRGLITYNRMLVLCGEEKVQGGDYYIWDDPNADKIPQVNVSLNSGSSNNNPQNNNKNGK